MLGRRLAAMVAVIVIAVPVVQATDLTQPADDALEYLAARIPAAGAFNANIAEAAYANGLDVAAWPSQVDPVADHLVVPGAEASNISLLRPLRALAMAGDARAGPDGALMMRVLAAFDDGGYGEGSTLNDDAYAILALRAAGLPVDDARILAARQHLLATQNDDGGWGWSQTAASGTDLTGLAVEALELSGGVPEGLRTPIGGFLAATQSAAGFAETPRGAANCESTVWGLRASSRLHLPARADDWRFLLDLQQPDGGFAHLPGGHSDLLCTTEAAALLGEVRAGHLAAPDFGADAVGMPALGFGRAVVMLAACAFLQAVIRRT